MLEIIINLLTMTPTTSELVYSENGESMEIIIDDDHPRAEKSVFQPPKIRRGKRDKEDKYRGWDMEHLIWPAGGGNILPSMSRKGKYGVALHHAPVDRQTRVVY